MTQVSLAHQYVTLSKKPFEFEHFVRDQRFCRSNATGDIPSSCPALELGGTPFLCTSILAVVEGSAFVFEHLLQEHGCVVPSQQEISSHELIRNWIATTCSIAATEIPESNSDSELGDTFDCL